MFGYVDKLRCKLLLIKNILLIVKKIKNLFKCLSKKKNEKIIKYCAKHNYPRPFKVIITFYNV